MKVSQLNTRILMVEGTRAGRPSFTPELEKRGYQVTSVRNGAAAHSRLLEVDPDILVIDADSLRTSGTRICQSIHAVLDDLPMILIVNPEAPLNGAHRDDCPVTTLVPPFTIQKLVNRIKPLLPGESKNLLRAGPLHLDLERQRVRCLDRTGNLTPNMLRVLKYLMDRPGEVVQRETLFQSVWETDYTQDTRTLDVHISWLRKLIEEDPRKPRFIVTVRSVGYRLDV